MQFLILVVISLLLCNGPTMANDIEKDLAARAQVDRIITYLRNHGGSKEMGDMSMWLGDEPDTLEIIASMGTLKARPGKCAGVFVFHINKPTESPMDYRCATKDGEKIELSEDEKIWTVFGILSTATEAVDFFEKSEKPPPKEKST